VTTLTDDLQRARSIEELQPLVAAIPYARFLGFSIQRDGTDVIGRMDFAEQRLGNVRIGAVHGGAIGALLELTAICKLLSIAETARVPKTVNITVEYLRSAQAVDTFARATVTRQGRRVANVRVLAYQDDAARPVAAANAHFLLAE
jgi:uncharacterized protein (TIGR00369 family)